MASSSQADPPHITNKAAVLYGIEDLVRRRTATLHPRLSWLQDNQQPKRILPPCLPCSSLEFGYHATYISVVLSVNCETSGGLCVVHRS
jgi:hypothetical protein